MDLEIIDYVDDSDCVVGSILRSEYKAVCPPYHIRGVQGFIINDQGQLWIPRRTYNKEFLPGGLDSSVGGFVQAGETYDQAFERELKEELNLALTDIKVSKIAYMSPIDGLPAFVQVYAFVSNTVPDFNREDFCEFMWLFPDEIEHKLAQGEPGKKILSHVKTLFCNKDSLSIR